MSRTWGFSDQTLSVLATLAVEPSDWRHGYQLAKQTQLRSGTLYPILIRLADRGLVEACWETGEPSGRPRRHLYRLTAQGLTATLAVLADHHPPRPAGAVPGRPAGAVPERAGRPPKRPAAAKRGLGLLGDGTS